MRNRRKYRKVPKYSLIDIPSGSSESIYYSPTENDLDLIYSSTNESKRAYMDPWDLENYDYVRKQLSLSPVANSSTLTPSGEPISPAFFYLPINTEECPTCYLSEQDFYNAKYETILDEDPINNTYTDNESSSSSHDRPGSTTDDYRAVSMLHTPGFGFGAIASGRRRRMVLPKPTPRLEFPAPPPYEYCIPVLDNKNCSFSECYECLTAESLYTPLSYIESGRTSPIYQRTSGSNRFGLSFDYSWNWNNLDRYIAKAL